MRKKLICIFSVFMMMSYFILGDVKVFDILDGQPQGITRNRLKSTAKYLFPNSFSQVLASKKKFFMTSLDSNFMLKKGIQIKKYSLPEKLKLLATPGDYYSELLIGISREKLANLPISISDLTGKNGTIRKSNLRLWEVIPSAINPDNRVKGDLIVDVAQSGVKSGEIIVLQLWVNIPASIQAGIYKGKIKVADCEVPLTVTVMPFSLPELKESAGFYLPGHFYRTSVGRFHNYADKNYTPETILSYFNFYRTRRLNSPTLYHIYPQLRLVNGKVEADFSDLDRFASAMCQAKLNGKLILEIRHITWWCNSAAIMVERSGGKAPAGILKLKSENGSPAVKFHPKAKDYFRQVLKLLLTNARKNNYPPILIITEEELSNSAGKLAGYEHFLPVIKEFMPNDTLIVDNQIGYGREKELDRGHRDNIKNRQYNSWTSKALQDVYKDGANVWSFNFDLQRVTFGLFQQRLNSQGYHQWADQWVGTSKEPFWRYCIISHNGISTTRSMEKAHDGRLDLAACKLLQAKIKDLKNKKLDSTAKELNLLLNGLLSDIPINGPRYRDWVLGVRGQDLSSRRDKLFSAINYSNRLLKLPHLVEKNVSGMPKIKTIKPVKSKLYKYNANVKILSLPICSQPVLLDARHSEASYVSTGPISYILNQENNIKAKCSTAGEFKKFTPSYSAAFVTYNKDGLLLAADANHLQPKGYFRYKREDNDPELWQDDSLQFFFYLPESKVKYHLIVNARGKRTLLKNGHVVKNNGVKVIARNPINGSGGVGIEALILWSALGLKKMPEAGTEWDFNFAREFHSFKQFTSWGRVYRSFHNRKKWGKIIFSGARLAVYFEKMQIPCLYPGNNYISGKIKERGGKNLVVRLRDSKGVLLASKKLNGGNVFTLNFNLKDDKPLTLQLSNASNKILDSILLPVYSFAPTVSIRDFNKIITSGDDIHLSCLLQFPSVDGYQISGCFINQAGERKNLESVMVEKAGLNWVGISTAGLAAGKWQLKLWIKGLESEADVSGVTLTIIPRFKSL